MRATVARLARAARDRLKADPANQYLERCFPSDGRIPAGELNLLANLIWSAERLATRGDPEAACSDLEFTFRRCLALKEPWSLALAGQYHLALDRIAARHPVAYPRDPE